MTRVKWILMKGREERGVKGFRGCPYETVNDVRRSWANTSLISYKERKEDNGRGSGVVGLS